MRLSTMPGRATVGGAVALCTLVGLTGLATAAAPSSAAPYSPAGACPPPTLGAPASPGEVTEQCQLLVRTTPARVAWEMRRAASHGLATGPLTPADLRAAYGLASAAQTRGAGETIAVVDAFRDPYIASDLARYRQLAGLGQCIAPVGAACLTILNQDGRPGPLPAGSAAGWSDEAAVDTEMIAAVCPRCRIALLEASSASLADLGTAVNSAARLARFIVDSWNGPDFPGESRYDTLYFNHPGVAITVASGDYRYSAGYPTSSQLVTSVGGTYLSAAGTARGWAEVAWSGQSTGPGTGTESGCSSGEPKPSWQSDPGCGNRTENDVAAVADAPQGVEFYSSAPGCHGLCQAYGTSVATAIIAAVYALAGTPRSGTYPAEYPYLHRAALHRVTSGSNGTCEAGRRYLCDGTFSLGDGYNGPDGMGTPDGTAAFAAPSGVPLVSVINPGTYDLQAGLTYRLPPIRAYSPAPGPAGRLAYAATGLPAGLSIDPATGSIGGTLPPDGPVDATVHVTVRDGTGARSAVSFRMGIVRSLAGAYRAGRGEIVLAGTGSGGRRMCLDDQRNRVRKGNPVQVWRCLNDRAQQWEFRPGGAPGGTGAVTIDGRCLAITGRGTSGGSRVALWPCSGRGSQQWMILGSAGELYNPPSGLCLDDPGGSRADGQLVGIAPCRGQQQTAWTLPASPITSGVTGKCADDLRGSRANGAEVVSWACDGSAAQRFVLGRDSTVRIAGQCLSVAGGSRDDGAAVQLWKCDGAPGEIFRVSSFGMLQNPGSQKCLANPGDSAANGTRLVIEDCYGRPGEIWSVS